MNVIAGHHAPHFAAALARVTRIFAFAVTIGIALTEKSVGVGGATPAASGALCLAICLSAVDTGARSAGHHPRLLLVL